MVSHFLGSRITNNEAPEAEYEEILMSLKLVYQKLVDLPEDSDPIEVRLECHSNLVVGQLNGAAACTHPLFERARDELFDIRASTLVSHIELHFTLAEILIV